MKQESKNIYIKMLKNVGMTVPKSRETSAVYIYMQQDRGWGQYNMQQDISTSTLYGLHMLLLLHDLIPCLAAYN